MINHKTLKEFERAYYNLKDERKMNYWQLKAWAIDWSKDRGLPKDCEFFCAELAVVYREKVFYEKQLNKIFKNRKKWDLELIK